MGIREDLKIIVITPVKNEEWILPFFLKATLNFADHIIIADQSSNDNSKRIIEKFSRVTIIDNFICDYREDLRQQLLIDTARELFPGPKVIFALDADEIISANSYNAVDWEVIKSSSPGAVFYFEKPELYGSAQKTIRYRHNLYPLAFFDEDKLEHFAKKIHSIRVPINNHSKRVDINGITFMHVSYLRPNVQRAKYRFYAVKEKMLGTSPWYRRRRRYRSPNHLLPWEPIEATPKEWLAFPSATGIDISTIEDTQNTWHNEDVWNTLRKHGSIGFWFDDIWDYPWKLHKSANNKKIGDKSILPPPALLRWLLALSDRLNK